MAPTTSQVREAVHRARHQQTELVRDLRSARLVSGLSQRRVAAAIGVSHELVSQWEQGAGTPTLMRAAAWGAVVGLDVSLRAFPGGRALRDAGQLRALARARERIGELWAWHTEVPVTADPRDRRAIDAVLRRDGVRIGLEVITRLVDAQAQVRAAALKQQAAGIDRMLLVLANTRHNRAAVASAAASLAPAFPISTRGALAALRAGVAPDQNAVLLV